MVCIYCNSQTQVVNTRHQRKTNQIWRRRKCTQCHALFTTQESYNASQAILVITKSREEPFSKDKLLLSVYDSLKHRKTAVSDATALTNTIVGQLYTRVNNATILNQTINNVCSTVLDRFDSIAATHYKAFHPIDKRMN